MSDDVQTRAGWHADPWGAAEERWSDGREWTTFVRSPGRGGAVRHDIPTNTPWIWLVVILPLVPWLSGVTQLLDASPPVPVGASALPLLWFFDAFVGVATTVLIVVFAAADRRVLYGRGIDHPFAWGWVFFYLLIFLGSGVYIIGRAVVLRRQTGTGLAPVWGWIAVSVISLVLFVAYLVSVVAALMSMPV